MQVIRDFSLIDFQVLDESGFAIGDIVYGFVEDDLEYVVVEMLEDGEHVNVPAYLFTHKHLRDMTIVLETDLIGVL